MRRAALLVCVVALGCSPPARVSVAAESCRSGPVTLWLDFDGAGVVHADRDDAAAMPLQSLLAPASTIVPPFDAAPIAPRVTAAQAQAAVVDRVRTLLAPFAVDVVTARPASPPYSRILVGGTAAAIGVSASEAGLGRVDCGNLTDGDVVYDFAAEQTPDYGGVVGIANTAAHEAGHAFGLEHVDDPHDVMYAAVAPMLTLPELFTLRFAASGSFSSYGSNGRACTSVDPVDEPALLDCNVGPRAAGGDVTPPTVSWDAPAGDVASSLTVSPSASDDVGVARVEVYKNLELVASLESPPYAARVEAAAGELFYVTVEAIDAAGNRATLSRALSAATPPAGALDAGALVGADAAAAPLMPTSSSGGCALSGGAAPSPWPPVLAVAAPAATLARSRRRRAAKSGRAARSG